MTKEFNLSKYIKREHRSNRSGCDVSIRVSKVKEFIKIVEDIIIKRKSRRLQLIELGQAIGDKLK